MAASGSGLGSPLPHERERIVEDEMSKIKPSLHRMLHSIEETFNEELNRERAEHEAKISALQSVLADLEFKLADSQTRLAHLGTLEQMQVKLELAESRLTKMDKLEVENRALKRELDNTRMKWTGMVHDGWGETASEKERYKLKLEAAEAQLILAKEQARAARRLIKKAGLVLKDGPDIRPPESITTTSSSSSTSTHRRHRRNEKRKA